MTCVLELQVASEPLNTNSLAEISSQQETLYDRVSHLLIEQILRNGRNGAAGNATSSTRCSIRKVAYYARASAAHGRGPSESQSTPLATRTKRRLGIKKQTSKQLPSLHWSKATTFYCFIHPIHNPRRTYFYPAQYSTAEQQQWPRSGSGYRYSSSKEIPEICRV